MDTLEKVPEKRRFDWLHVTLILLLAIIVTLLASFWLFKVYLFPDQFTPVTLNTHEERVLSKKIHRLAGGSLSADQQRSVDGKSISLTEKNAVDEELRPEPYTEELNALVAENTDLANRVAIDLSDNLLSAKLLVPMNDDFPVIGGKTIKVHAGLELSYADNKPVVVLKGIRIMGVPLPSSWLGNMKNIDLVEEFGREAGFWQALASGIDHVQVRQNQLNIRLKE